MPDEETGTITVSKLPFQITEKGEVVVRGLDFFSLVLTALLQSMDEETRTAVLGRSMDTLTAFGAFRAVFTEDPETGDPIAVFTPDLPTPTDVERVQKAKFSGGVPNPRDKH